MISLPINGGHLYIRRLRPDEVSGRPPIILLHEALGSIAQWRDFPEQLAGRCRCEVIVYERRGHGRSSPLTGVRGKDYLHREALGDLPVLLERLEIEKPVLIGHSDGGSIALIYAAHYEPAAIVTLAAHVIVEAVTLEGIEATRRQRTQLVGRLKKYHGDKADLLFDAWADTWRSPSFRDWSITGLLPQITCPTLVIQGANDEYGTAEQVRLIEAGVSGTVQTVLLDDCGHAPHREWPERVVGEVDRWLRDSGYQEVCGS